MTKSPYPLLDSIMVGPLLAYANIYFSSPLPELYLVIFLAVSCAGVLVYTTSEQKTHMLSFVERSSSPQTLNRYTTCFETICAITIWIKTLSFIGRLSSFQSVLYQRFQCTSFEAKLVANIFCCHYFVGLHLISCSCAQRCISRFATFST